MLPYFKSIARIYTYSIQKDVSLLWPVHLFQSRSDRKLTVNCKTCNWCSLVTKIHRSWHQRGSGGRFMKPDSRLVTGSEILTRSERSPVQHQQQTTISRCRSPLDLSAALYLNTCFVCLSIFCYFNLRSGWVTWAGEQGYLYWPSTPDRSHFSCAARHRLENGCEGKAEFTGEWAETKSKNFYL